MNTHDYGILCKKCKKRKICLFNGLDGLCPVCKARRILREMDKADFLLARTFSGVLK